MNNGLILTCFIDLPLFFQISKLLEHPTLFEAAELAFDVISVEVPELDLPMVKLLFKQKIFHVVLHKLWDKLVKFEESHINAFAFVLGMAPHPVLKMYLEKVNQHIYSPVLFNDLSYINN